jgi:monoterpene epsilon-lactone hydrolase
MSLPISTDPFNIPLTRSVGTQTESRLRAPDGLSDAAMLAFSKLTRIEGATPKEAWASIRPFVNDANKGPSEAAKLKYLESVEEHAIAGVPVLTLTPKDYDPSNDDKIILYIHGGAYVLGSAPCQLQIASPVAHKTGVKVISIDYPLAPEHPFPAAHNACLDVYRDLLQSYDSKKIVLFGDSAGAGLAVGLTLMATDQDLPLPGAVAAYSPWCDMTQESDSYKTLGSTEISAKLSPECLQGCRDALTEDAELWVSPYLSPIYGDFEDIDYPPVLITTGTRDLFLGESAALAAKLQDADVPVRYYVDQGLWHNYQEETETPEALRCAERTARFIRKSIFSA